MGLDNPQRRSLAVPHCASILMGAQSPHDRLLAEANAAYRSLHAAEAVRLGVDGDVVVVPSGGAQTNPSSGVPDSRSHIPCRENALSPWITALEFSPDGRGLRAARYPKNRSSSRYERQYGQANST
jgi:hypothetical protein